MYDKRERGERPKSTIPYIYSTHYKILQSGVPHYIRVRLKKHC